MQCTYRDLTKLRGIPNNPSALAKLANWQSTSLVDKMIVKQFLRPITARLVEFEQIQLELLVKYGEVDPVLPSKYLFPKPGSRAVYNAEEKKLLDAECTVDVVPLPVRIYQQISELSPGDLDVLEIFCEPFQPPAPDLPVQPPA